MMYNVLVACDGGAMDGAAVREVSLVAYWTSCKVRVSNDRIKVPDRLKPAWNEGSIESLWKQTPSLWKLEIVPF